MIFKLALQSLPLNSHYLWFLSRSQTLLPPTPGLPGFPIQTIPSTQCRFPLPTSCSFIFLQIVSWLIKLFSIYIFYYNLPSLLLSFIIGEISPVVPLHLSQPIYHHKSWAGVRKFLTAISVLSTHGLSSSTVLLWWSHHLVGSSLSPSEPPCSVMSV